MNTSHARAIRTLTILLVISWVLSMFFVSPAAAATSALDFRNTMRKLWEDHITWTRLYIISAAADLPDKDAAAQRLLQNQADIGNAIQPYYGDAGRVDAASKKWYANADDIATFLNGANPRFGTLAELKAGMKMHLDLTLAEAVARLQGKYADDIADYDKVHEHILGLADTLSNGIIAQFPDRFDAGRPAETSFHSAMRK